MRADAEKNYNKVLAVARDIFTEHSADASMRDIARRSGVGLATLLRHFPSRDALFEALLCTNLDALTQRADELETADSPDEALVSWFREWVAFAQSCKGAYRYQWGRSVRLDGCARLGSRPTLVRATG